ncbi:MAG: alpha-L-fucosidase [Phycisphaerae bacterium]|nr:alpha-L-fucosidase [Phycisphaerae bacterium]
MNHIRHLIVTLLLTTPVLHAAETPQAAPPDMPRPYPERMKWWGEARFGMFIHWGPVSLKGTEISWSRANSNPKCPNRGPIPVEVYDNLFKQFNPTKFDAARWVSLAKAAGMKYMVLTAKHCDGFLLWDSKASDYNIMNTPFKRDVCAELARAAHEQGMRLGWYFSPMDWRDPDFRTQRNKVFLERMKAELRELLSNYGTIDLLWFDWDSREPLYDQAETYRLVKSLQPKIVINNRLDLGPEPIGHSDWRYIGSEADYYTPEQIIGGFDVRRPWESCMTLSSRDQWSWGGPEDGVKPYEACMDMLIRGAGGDGNILLNVGPMPSGEIAPDQANRIKEMGVWLAEYGQSIYGTRGGPFKPGDYGVSTRKGNTIYLHIRDWTEDAVKLPAIPAKVVKSEALTGGKAVVHQTATGLDISVPQGDRQALDTIVALELDRSSLAIPAIEVPAPKSLTTNAKATASNVYQNQAEYGADRAVDGRNDTRWATDGGVRFAWLEVDLGKPATIGRAVIKQAFPELKRVRKFAIEYFQDDQWRPCYQGENLGAQLAVSFDPVTAQRVRLNITEATDGPTIWEFHLFGAAR